MGETRVATPPRRHLGLRVEEKIQVRPMLIQISNCREGRSLQELAKSVKEAGQRNINLASEVLQKKS